MLVCVDKAVSVLVPVGMIDAGPVETLVTLLGGGVDTTELDRDCVVDGRTGTGVELLISDGVVTAAVEVGGLVTTGVDEVIGSGAADGVVTGVVAPVPGPVMPEVVVVGPSPGVVVGPSPGVVVGPSPGVVVGPAGVVVGPSWPGVVVGPVPTTELMIDPTSFDEVVGCASGVVDGPRPVTTELTCDTTEERMSELAAVGPNVGVVAAPVSEGVGWSVTVGVGDGVGVAVRDAPTSLRTVERPTMILPDEEGVADGTTVSEAVGAAVASVLKVLGTVPVEAVPESVGRTSLVTADNKLLTRGAVEVGPSVAVVSVAPGSEVAVT